MGDGFSQSANLTGGVSVEVYRDTWVFNRWEWDLTRQDFEPERSRIRGAASGGRAAATAAPRFRPSLSTGSDAILDLTSSERSANLGLSTAMRRGARGGESAPAASAAAAASSGSALSERASASAGAASGMPDLGASLAGAGAAWAADLLDGARGVRDLQPVAARALARVREDLERVARLHPVVERHHLAVDLGAGAVRADVGVDGVREVAVVGRPDDTWGECVVAFVIPRDEACDREALRAQLEAHCRASLAKFKTPREIRIVDDVPRIGFGKVAKIKLREMLTAEKS